MSFRFRTPVVDTFMAWSILRINAAVTRCKKRLQQYSTIEKVPVATTSKTLPCSDTRKPRP
eukprot:10178515-Lingulodinium_polyedra.AAC.1